MTDSFFNDKFDVPLMAILRGYDPEVTVRLAQRAWQCGIELVEVPIQDAAARPSLQAAVRAGSRAGYPVGAGTVITPEQVEFAAQAGARFTVAPGLSEEVLHACRTLAMPHLPGVATPSDVTRATRLGLTWLKLFPAGDLGPSWPASMRGPFPEARFVATGGINLDNAGEYLARGAAAALGSALADDEQFDRLPRFIDALNNKGTV